MRVLFFLINLFYNIYNIFILHIMSNEIWGIFDAVFWITISTLVCGSFGLVVRYCLKSKCDNINICCGLINVHRDVKAEIDLEMKEIENNIEDEEEKKP